MFHTWGWNEGHTLFDCTMSACVNLGKKVLMFTAWAAKLLMLFSISLRVLSDRAGLSCFSLSTLLYCWIHLISPYFVTNSIFLSIFLFSFIKADTDSFTFTWLKSGTLHGNIFIAISDIQVQRSTLVLGLLHPLFIWHSHKLIYSYFSLWKLNVLNTQRCWVMTAEQLKHNSMWTLFRLCGSIPSIDKIECKDETSNSRIISNAFSSDKEVNDRN